MAEYIDREKARNGACNGCTHRIGKEGCGWPEPCQRLLGALILAESEDVAPVVHGKWLDEDFPEKTATVHGFAICSACGKLSHKAEHGYNILSNYCPNCGAKMDL